MKSFDRLQAITWRIIRQLTRDHRSIALIFIAPLIVMSLIGFSFQNQPIVLNRAAPAIIATMSLVFIFMLTGVSFLRERSEGTLDRLLVTETNRVDVIVGYMFGFLVFALIQSTLILLFTVYVVGIDHSGTLWEAFVILIILTITSVSPSGPIWIVQFIPLFISPQVFLSGIFLPVEQLPQYFQPLSKIFPLTYANRALQDIMLGGSIRDVQYEVGISLLFALLLLILAMVSVRR